MRRLTVWIVSLSLFGAFELAQAAEPPRAVSPGALDRVTSVVGACPTFSWSAEAGARGYEIVVYRLSEEGLDGPVRRIEVPAGATSWSPSAEECLAPGVSHAWLVRSVTDGGPGAWSEPALFEIAAGPSTGEVEAAIETLRRYLAGEREDAGEIGAQAPGAAPAGSVEAIDGGLGEEALDLPARHDRPGTVPPALRSKSHATAVAKDVPAASSTPSLTVSDQIHLGAASDLFKDGSVFLWDDTLGNTALGREALSSATGYATGNTAFGRQALRDTTEGANFSNGSRNTAVGDQALSNNTTASANTASGYQALFANTTGRQNTASGFQTLSSNTTGKQNTAHGFKALLDITTGDSNTASGWLALSQNATGSRNVALGFRTGYNLGLDVTDPATTMSDNIFIGNEGESDEQQTIRIGTDTHSTKFPGPHTRAFIAGIAGVEVTGDAVLVTSDGQLGISTSSRRYKEEIRELEAATDELKRLRPVSFRFRPELVAGGGDPEVGLIAEEVAEPFPELVTRDAEDRPRGVRYELLSVLLLKELQLQQARLEALQRRVGELDGREAKEPRRPWWRRCLAGRE